jgi:hypothetical protein
LSNVTTTDITAIDNSSTVNSINNNIHTLRDEFDKVVYKDGREELTGDLDANSQRIINLPYAGSNSEPVVLGQIDDAILNAGGSIAAEALLRIAGDSARPTSATLAATGGAALIGKTGGGTVQDAITSLTSSVATNTSDIAANLSLINTIDATVDGFSLSGKGRSAPDAAFNVITADFTVISAEDGHAAVAQDIFNVFDSKYPRSGIPSGTVTKYIAPWGNDSNTGDSWGSPYLTLGKTRTVLCGEVQIAPGTYAFDDWRYTDTNGTHPRRFIAPFGGVTLKTSGTDLSGLTFTANGTYPDVWEATLAATPVLNRLLRTDVLDSEGLPLPMPRYTSLVDVSNSLYGWYHDTAGAKLYVRVGTLNINTSFKANLQGKYRNASNDQILLYSSRSYWENINFEAFLYPLHVSGQTPPEVWLKNCNIRYSFTHGILLEGGKAYHQGCTAYRTGGDGANYNLGTGSQAGYFIEIDFRTRFAGDEDSYPGQVTNPVASSFNKQGSSNHNTIGIRVGGNHDGSAGQLIADTLVSGVRSKSWILGTVFGRSRAPLSSGVSYGYNCQNADAWIEGVTVKNSANGALYADGTGIISYFNTRGNRSVAGSGSFVTYLPTI